MRQSSRERIITDSRGLLNLNNKQLLDFFDLVHSNAAKILSSQQTANAMRKQTPVQQLGARPKDVNVNVAAVGPSCCRICGKNNHVIQDCHHLKRTEDPGRRRSLIIKSKTCFACCQPYQQGHQCGAAVCEQCRLGRRLCGCRNSQFRDKRSAGHGQSSRPAAHQGQAAGQSSRPAAHQGQVASKVQHHTARPAQQSGTTHPTFQGQSSGGSQQDGAAALAVSSNSVSIVESTREVIMLGSSLVSREMVCIEGDTPNWDSSFGSSFSGRSNSF